MTWRLDLVTLELLVAVVEEGSFAKAAERKRIAISAISRRIAELEEGCGVQLLNRRHNGVEPTAAGLSALEHARSVLRDVRNFETELRGYASGNFGLIRIHASESAVCGAIPETLKRYLDDHPMVRIELAEATSQSVVRAVLENRADLGLYVGDLPASGIDRFRIGADRLMVLVPTQHPLAHLQSTRFHDLLGDNFICHEADSVIEQLTQAAARQAGRTLTSRIRVTSFDTACRMVAAGLGIAIAAERIAAQLAPVMQLRLLEISEPWAIRPHYACIRKGAPMSTASRRLIELLAANFREQHPHEPILKSVGVDHGPEHPRVNGGSQLLPESRSDTRFG